MITGRVIPSSTPYPWPFHECPDPSRMALVIAGAHEAWRDRSVGCDGVHETLGGLAATLGEHGVLVIRLRHTGRGVTADDPMVAIVHDLDVTAGGLDGFLGSPLAQILRDEGRDTLAIGGFGLEGPVHSTLRSANDMGLECLTVTNASAPLSRETAGPAIHMITMSGGIFGAVASSAALTALVTTTTTEDR